MLDIYSQQGKGYQDQLPDDQKALSAMAMGMSEQEIIAAEKAYRLGTRAVRDLIAPAAFKITGNYVELGDRVLRTLFVTAYPRYISVGWFAPIINLNLSLDVSMFFYNIPNEIILKELRNKVGVIQAALSQAAEKGSPRDPSLEIALSDIEGLRDSLISGSERYFRFGLYITVYAKDVKELDAHCEKIESIFGSKLIYTRRGYFQSEQGFNSTLPIGLDDLGITYNMSSGPLAASFPFMSAELSSEGGILYGINRHNNSLILFDRFSLQNANSIIFATSGAGKSYTVKLEVLRSMMMGTDVIIIDPEKEYTHLCSAVGGSYIDISLNSPAKINPFDLPLAVGDMSAGDIIRSAVITIKGMLRIMLGKITDAEDSILDQALIQTYAKKDITGDVDLSLLDPTSMPIMQDFMDVLEGMVGTESLVLRLRKYTEGTFAGLFNSQTNVNVHNQLVVFSVRDLEDELRPIGVYSIVSYIWNVVRSSLRRRILLIDEAWWLMQNEDSAKFIFAIVKRCRKYYLGVTTITQDVNDFLRSQYGQAIVTNSSMQILLKQSPASIDLIGKTFLLTQGEKFLLLESGVGEGIMFAGAKHAAMKVIASYSEDQLITTDPRQLLAIEESKKEFAASQIK